MSDVTERTYNRETSGLTLKGNLKKEAEKTLLESVTLTNTKNPYLEEKATENTKTEEHVLSNDAPLLKDCNLDHTEEHPTNIMENSDYCT